MKSRRNIESRPGSSPHRNGAVRAATPLHHEAAITLARDLGEREREVMSVVWREGGSVSVLHVAQRLSTSLAYTTVMTTLDRLYKKGLLLREKKNRAFVYSAAISEDEMKGKRAANLIRSFFSGAFGEPDLLVSYLVDAVSDHDRGLLDELESKVRRAKAKPRLRDADSESEFPLLESD